jgi:hypothetical protein
MLAIMRVYDFCLVVCYHDAERVLGGTLYPRDEPGGTTVAAPRRDRSKAPLLAAARHRRACPNLSMGYLKSDVLNCHSNRSC